MSWNSLDGLPSITLKESDSREGGLGCGTHVNPWLFHFNV